MSDVGLIAIILVFFALAIGLVRVLGRLIDSGAPDDWADEPTDADYADTANRAGIANGTSASPTVIDPRRPR
jgi:hypothetical protein